MSNFEKIVNKTSDLMDERDSLFVLKNELSVNLEGLIKERMIVVDKAAAIAKAEIMTKDEYKTLSDSIDSFRASWAITRDRILEIDSEVKTLLNSFKIN
jgi:hypothetical protein